MSTPTSIRIRRLASGAGSERGLLDTSAVIGIESIEPSRLPVASAISCLTLAELRSGPYAATDAVERLRRRRHLARIEPLVTALPFEARCASAYGQVHAAVAAVDRKPRGSRAVDLMIAATACAHELPLYTLNAADLAGLESLVEIVDLT